MAEQHRDATQPVTTQERLRGLLSANRSIVADLDLSTVLRRIVEAACDLVGAQYGAIGVIAPDGNGLEEFIFVGMDEDDVRRIGHLPQGKGLLGALIDEPQPIRLDHMRDDPRAVGFPAGHPDMDSFLGVPVRVREEIFGNLYLANAASTHFDEDDEALMQSLAATAGVAIANARLYLTSRQRQEWLQASTEATRQALGVAADPIEQTVVDTVARLADADLVVLVEPDESVEQLVVTAAGGDLAEMLDARTLPLAGTVSAQVLADGLPTLIDDAAQRDVEGSYVPRTLSLGPAMLLPLTGATSVRGVLIASRLRGRRRFDDSQLEMAATFATHVSLALELAQARRDQQRMAVLEDRTRIARDLHDHVIQQLFAAGMTVQGVASGVVDPTTLRHLDTVVDTLDDAVKRIRTSIFQLQAHRHAGPSLRSDVLRVVSDVAPALGHEPHVTFDGPVDAVSDGKVNEDVLAVVREALTNVAKHARAHESAVHLRATQASLELVVTDDGLGMRGDSRRSGLANLRQRAERRGGACTVNEPPPAQGTVLRWSVPLH